MTSRLVAFMRSYAPLLALGSVTALLITGYFTGIPWVSDTTDPVFHCLRNLYSAMWSNMWAPSVWTLTGFVISDIRHSRRAKQVKDHVTNTMGTSNG